MQMLFSVFIMIVLTILICIESNASDERQNQAATNDTNQIINDTIEEPSGIVFSPKTKTLFVVSDDGYLSEIATSGEVLRRKYLCVNEYDCYDLEGICLGTKNTLLLAVEHSESILEVSIKDFKILNEITISRIVQGHKILIPDEKCGIESITNFNGRIYLTYQAYRTIPDKDRPFIPKWGLPSILFRITDTSPNAHIDDVFIFDYMDLSAMDQKDGFLYIVSDYENILIKFDVVENKNIEEYSLPGDEQEGIAFDNNGYMYIAQDSGGILKIKFKKFIKKNVLR
jgi:uncharacterized protein YjiK